MIEYNKNKYKVRGMYMIKVKEREEKFVDGEKKIYYTYHIEDRGDFTCSEICNPKSEIEDCDVYDCCRFCSDKPKACQKLIASHGNLCSFFNELDDAENDHIEDFCEYEWSIERCFKCGQIIDMDEDCAIDDSDKSKICSECEKNA